MGRRRTVAAYIHAAPARACAEQPNRPGIRLSDIRAPRRGAGRRRVGRPCAPRRRPQRDARLLDRPAPCGARLHDRRAVVPDAFRVRPAGAAPPHGGRGDGQRGEPARARKGGLRRGRRRAEIHADRRRMARPRDLRNAEHRRAPHGGRGGRPRAAAPSRPPRLRAPAALRVRAGIRQLAVRQGHGHLAGSRFPADTAPRGNARAGTRGRPGPAFGGASLSVQTLRRGRPRPTEAPDRRRPCLWRGAICRRGRARTPVRGRRRR